MAGEEHVLGAAGLADQREHPIDVAGMRLEAPLGFERHVGLLERLEPGVGLTGQILRRDERKLSRPLGVQRQDRVSEVVVDRCARIAAQPRREKTESVLEVAAAAIDDPDLDAAAVAAVFGIIVVPVVIPVSIAFSVPILVGVALPCVGLVDQLRSEPQPVWRDAAEPAITRTPRAASVRIVNASSACSTSPKPAATVRTPARRAGRPRPTARPATRDPRG